MFTTSKSPEMFWYTSFIFLGTWEELVDKEDDGVGLSQYVEEVDLRLGAGLG